MKIWNHCFSVGILAILILGCSGGSSLNGTWENKEDVTILVSGKNITIKYPYGQMQGTYSISGDTIEISIDGETDTAAFSRIDNNTIMIEGERFTRGKSLKDKPASVKTLTAGKEITANLGRGEIQTYRIRLGKNSSYIIEWKDSDTDRGYADIKVGLKRETDSNYLIRVSDDGNFDENKHRVSDFVPNSWYIIEVQGYDRDESGTYKIMFY